MNTFSKIIITSGVIIISAISILMTIDFLTNSEANSLKQQTKNQEKVETPQPSHKTKNPQGKEKKYQDYSGLNRHKTYEIEVVEMDQKEQKKMYKRGKIIDELIEIDPQEQSYENFKDYLNKSKSILPKQKEIKELSDHQVHMTPYSVSLAGEFFAHLRQTLEERPDLWDQAENYYNECAKNDNLIDSIRALCLTNYAEEKIQRGQSVNFENYPRNISNLAKSALGLP